MDLRKKQSAEPGLPSLSTPIGVATTLNLPLTSLGQVSQLGAELKSCVKTLGGNRCVIDRHKD
ncbi:MAG: hypothetical protein A3G41_05070 [Elusimicrobia bacterium RIFCSPLOWO2_12_FULL_59_9]|nr:MAG: hypothetical protein A3G41_05070 [Elusimicrobia bacterium RIFCSPLOWO2_12_FULL_59_9]